MERLARLPNVDILGFCGTLFGETPEVLLDFVAAPSSALRICRGAVKGAATPRSVSKTLLNASLTGCASVTASFLSIAANLFVARPASVQNRSQSGRPSPDPMS